MNAAALLTLISLPIGAIAILLFARGRRRRPGLPAPDRATVRDCFKPIARQ